MLEELYQEVILDQSQSPKFRGDLAATPGARHELVYNPLCGDKIDLWVSIQDGVVREVKFCGSGCAISQASASLLADLVRDKPVGELPALIDDFQDMLAGRESPELRERLGQLIALEGVRKFPARRRCAALAFEALKRIISSEAQ